jgi:hypothetical protein
MQRRGRPLSSVLVDQLVAALSTDDIRDRLVSRLVNPVFHTGIFKKIRNMMYALLAMILLMFVLLVVQTVQLTYICWKFA